MIVIRVSLAVDVYVDVILADRLENEEVDVSEVLALRTNVLQNLQNLLCSEVFV